MVTEVDMKRIIFLIFAMLIANLPSSAVILTEEVTSATYIKKHGYSDEMCRLIDLQNAHINGVDTTYPQHVWSGKDIRVPAYIARKLPKGYEQKLADTISEKRVNFVKKIFCYFDPGIDDGEFGNNKIKYTTGFEDL